MPMSEAAEDVRPTGQAESDHAEQAATAAKRLGKFASAHGGAKYVFVEYVSATRSRIVVVAEDGRFGDQVVDSYEAAMDACARAGFEVLEGEWEREAVGAVLTTGYEWSLMGKGRPAGR